MTNSVLKGIKCIANITIMALFITSTSCIPQAFQPVTTGQTPAPDTRANLCNLLLSVGGTADDVNVCLTTTSISDKDKARLCAASAGLTDAQKETLRTGLTSLGVDVNTCNILTVTPTASPSTLPTGEPTTVSGPTSNPTAGPTTEPTAGPTVAPTATNQPIPSSSPTTGTGGGGGVSNGGFGGGNVGGPVPTSLTVNVTVSDSPIPAITVTTSPANVP